MGSRVKILNSWTIFVLHNAVTSYWLQKSWLPLHISAHASSQRTQTISIWAGYKLSKRKQFPCKNGVIRPTETKTFSKSPLLKWKPHCFAQFLIDNDEGWISLIGQNTFRNLIKMKQQLRQRKTFRINVISATLKIPQRFSTAVKN